MLSHFFTCRSRPLRRSRSSIPTSLQEALASPCSLATPSDGLSRFAALTAIIAAPRSVRLLAQSANTRLASPTYLPTAASCLCHEDQTRRKRAHDPRSAPPSRPSRTNALARSVPPKVPPVPAFQRRRLPLRSRSSLEQFGSAPVAPLRQEPPDWQQCPSAWRDTNSARSGPCASSRARPCSPLAPLRRISVPRAPRPAGWS